jgi:hypothetical protein
MLLALQLVSSRIGCGNGSGRLSLISCNGCSKGALKCRSRGALKLMMEMNSMVSEESLGVGPGVGPGSVVVAQWPEVGPGVGHGPQGWVRW